MEHVSQSRSGGWEIVQFVNATLTGTRTYDLTQLLRGQLGTEDAIETALAAGARIVVLDNTLIQMALDLNDLGREFYLKYGPANRDIGDSTYLTTQKTFNGRGLKPFSPVHLSATTDGSGTTLNWVRRDRINSDSWEYTDDIPMNEAYERYEIDIKDGTDTTVRTITVDDATSVLYTAAEKSTDGISTPFDYVVYQISDQVGRGTGRRGTAS